MNHIGTVTFVSFDKLAFEISDFGKLQFNADGDFYFTKGVLDFVTIINNQNDKFIYQVERIEDKEKILSREENGKFEYVANVWATPIGTIINGKINFNLKTYPFLQNKVYLTSNEEFDIIFNRSNNHSVNLGTIADKFEAKLDVNKLFTYHTAILGNTGSGKSTTIRQILAELNKQETTNLKIYIFDVHNEYSGLVGNSINVLKDFKIDVKSLVLQDWINLVKPSDLVQLPLLRTALKLGNALEKNLINEDWLRMYLAYELYNNVQTDAVPKRSKIVGLLRKININTSLFTKFGNFESEKAEKDFLYSLLQQMDSIHPSGGNENYIYLQNIIKDSEYSVSDFESLTKGLEYVFLLEESKGNTQARAYSATLETRIKEIEQRYTPLFSGNQSSDSNQSSDLKDKFVIYNVSQLEDDMLLFFVSYISKRVFEQSKNCETIDGREVNVLLLEEAHRYISNDKENSQIFELDTFKRIAREGRKFGVFLFLSSQRPSELSGTLLSQANNFLLHRIKNNVDLEYLAKTVPYVTQNQLKRLSFLPTGTTYVVGELFPIPTEIDVHSPNKVDDVTQTPPIKFKSTN